MKLSVRHTYPCTPEIFWEMYWDDEFDAQLQADSTVDREVLSEIDEGGVVVRRLRFTPQNELPSPVARIVGTKKLTYEQVNRWDRAAGRMSWEVLPSFLSADKFSAKGVFDVKGVGDGCEMIVDGDITVNVRFIGGQIEKQIVAQIQVAYDRMLDTGKSWLTSTGKAT